MYKRYFILDLAIFIYLIDVSIGIVQHGYMTNFFYSHRNVEVNDSMVLELTSRMLDDKPAENHLACDVNIVTLTSRRILIHFLSLEISFDEKEVDRLHVYDYTKGGQDTRLTPSQGLYGLYDSHYHGVNGRLDDYVSTGNRLKLDYQGKPTLAYDGFKILITSFRDSRGDCGRGYLRCVRKNICIPVSLWCDGYQNCGNDDNSDEINCNLTPDDEWEPIDGALAGVLASGASSLVFVISLAILAYVVLRISKRQHIITNVVVEYKKRKSPKRQISNGEMLTRLYAPPSYEVVIGMDEDPPPYQMITAEIDTESDEDDGVLREQPNHDYETLPAVLKHAKENAYNTQIENIPSCSNKEPSMLNSKVVSCDVHGNDVKEPKIETENTPIHPDDHNTSSEYLAQTNFKLCSVAQPNDSLENISLQKNNHCPLEPEIEVLSSDHESDSSKDSNSNSKRRCNGNLSKHDIESNGTIPNGDAVKFSKQNGHTVLEFERSRSNQDQDCIEYIDSD